MWALKAASKAQSRNKPINHYSFSSQQNVCAFNTAQKADFLRTALLSVFLLGTFSHCHGLFSLVKEKYTVLPRPYIWCCEMTSLCHFYFTISDYFSIYNSNQISGIIVCCLEYFMNIPVAPSSGPIILVTTPGYNFPPPSSESFLLTLSIVRAGFIRCRKLSF